ncbi:MAG: transposase [Paramuribaculum sp.]|nr:transposase [Paramuribaculum sp.]
MSTVHRKIESDGTLHERKYARVDWHNYNVGTFFVTFSTLDKVHYFGQIEDGAMNYTEIGKKMVDVLLNVPLHYDDVKILRWVVMPNHVHLIVKIGSGNSSEGVIQPTQRKPIVKDFSRNRLSSFIGNLKSEVSRYAKKNGLIFCWNPRFHEHIIFDCIRENAIFDYVDNNIRRWSEDCYK